MQFFNEILSLYGFWQIQWVSNLLAQNSQPALLPCALVPLDCGNPVSLNTTYKSNKWLCHCGQWWHCNLEMGVAVMASHITSTGKEFFMKRGELHLK